MRRFEIELSDDALDEVLVQELRNAKELFEVDLEEEENSIAIFDADRKKDRKLIKKHIKALNLILNYYGYYDAS